MAQPPRTNLIGACVNRVTLLGRIAELPVSAGENRITFSLITSTRRRVSDGFIYRHDRHQVVVTSPVIASYAKNSLKAGTRVHLDGNLIPRLQLESSGVTSFGANVLVGNRGSLLVIGQAPEGWTPPPNTVKVTTPGRKEDEGLSLEVDDLFEDNLEDSTDKA